jgi:long-chain fatty acid transport protein
MQTQNNCNGCKFMNIKLAILLPSLLSISNSFAGGFQMHEQNASLGDVHASNSVIANDASIGFYNPAGLIDIETPKVTVATVAVTNNMSFKGQTIVDTNPPSDNPIAYPPVIGSGKVSTNGLHVIPSMHFATPINDRFAFGLSIASPFAAELGWSDNKFTRFNTTQNAIKTINFSPSLAMKVNNELAVGFGPEIQYVDMQINKMVGVGYGFAKLFSNAEHDDPDFFDNLDEESKKQVTKSFDSKVTNNLTNIALGWHAGLLWKPINNFKLGFRYRDKIEHHATGESKLKGKLAGSHDDFSPNKENKSKKLKAIIKIPASTTLSVEYKPFSTVSLVSSLIYTQWNTVKYFNLKNVPTSFSDPTTQAPLYTKLVTNKLGFRNTFTLLNGVHWRYNNKLLLKTGLGYDQTPSNDSYRDLKIPDGNRILFGLGGNYDYTKNLNIEVGYMFVNVRNTKISNISIIPAADIEYNLMNPGEINAIKGRADGYAHLLGFQFTLNTPKVMQYFI